MIRAKSMTDKINELEKRIDFLEQMVFKGRYISEVKDNILHITYYKDDGSELVKYEFPFEYENQKT
jgi:hypothetical protein